MTTIKLSEDELSKMREFYEFEEKRLSQHLEHIKNVLSQLGDNRVAPKPTVAAVPESKEQKVLRTEKPRVRKLKVTGTAVEAPKLKKKSATAAAKAPKKGKRGPKPVWGNFILDQLKKNDHPMTYNELVDEAMSSFKGKNVKERNARQSILNSAFRLRSIQKKIDTFGIDGQKEKFLGLKSWFDDKGKVKNEYRKKVLA